MYLSLWFSTTGGVFIATLFGLALAMITLCAEIIYHKRKKNKKTPPEKLQENVHFGILSKKEFGMTAAKQRSNIIKPDVTYISVFPHSQLY